MKNQEYLIVATRNPRCFHAGLSSMKTPNTATSGARPAILNLAVYYGIASDHIQTVDLIDAPLYIGVMKEKTASTPQELDLDRFESSLEELIQLCERLHTENNLLRGQQKPLASERIKLIETNSLVRNKMEAVIKRLKTMELEL